MSDPGSAFGAGSRGDNPVAGMLVAMCDAWTLALAALRSAAAGAQASPTGAAAPGSDPVSDLVAGMSGFAAAMRDLASRASGSRLGPPETAPATPEIQPADLAPLMARACVVAAGSTLNYWRSLAEIYARHQASLLQAVIQQSAGEPVAGDAGGRLLADELRAYFREVGEAATREARRLEEELAQIGAAVAAATEPPDPAAPHRRHWKAKG